MPNHTVAINMVMEALQDKDHGVITNTDEISAIGHRVLHAGIVYSESVVVNEDVKRVIRECFDLGPLHNPANLMGIEACEEAMPGKPNVAVWDTGFGMSCQRRLICTLFLMNTMRNTVSVVMASTEQAICLYPARLSSSAT